MKYDVCVIGSGMSGLAAACFLAHKGLKVVVAEQNYLPGGCTSAYWRKGFVFEAGATTLVGLDNDMPLKYLLDTVGVQIDALPLSVNMRVVLKDGTVITRYQNLNEWIAEAERVFGKKGQASFWRFCYKISQFVWRTSGKQFYFPPATPADLWECIKNTDTDQLLYARYALISIKKLLKKYDLLENKRFVDFVNEQLLITAQNHLEEVNVLFGATALCYTNFTNYYVKGGLINLVQPLIDYLQQQGGELLLRTAVSEIIPNENGYEIHRPKNSPIQAKYIISSVPLNNTLKIFKGNCKTHLHRQTLKSAYLNSAFQMGIAFKTTKVFDCIHFQLHLPTPLPQIDSASIFVSLSHPSDTTRSDEQGYTVASVSTHVKNPENQIITDKKAVELAVIECLEVAGILKKEDIVYQHSSTPLSWEKWTMREYGFVGGYPQYISVKPWQMVEHRLDGKGAYICGDTTYPGQGIPGATLSGLIAAKKLLADNFNTYS
jgi:C-3',4' desaturase CrtD